MNNPYHVMACLAGHPDASSLAEDLTRWHDRMVNHVRRYGSKPADVCCADDECPREEATQLWAAARRVFGDQATRLTFLSTQAAGGAS